MKIKSLVGLFTAAALSMSVATTAVADDKVLLKLPVWFGTHLIGLGSAPVYFADTLNAASGGSVRVKVYEPGKLVANKEIMENVSNGTVNAGWSTPGYNTGLLGLGGNLFSAVPFGPEAGEYLAWVLYGGGGELWQGIYDDAGLNIKAIPCSIIAPETSGWFHTPIEGVEDLDGLRMRFFGLGAKVMEKLGVQTFLLAGGDIMPAIEKGALDATEFSMPAIDKLLGFPKLLKHNYFPGWHQQSTMFDLLINGDTWAGMSDSQQALVEMACKATMLDGYAQGEAIQFGAMKANAEAGVTNHYWSDEMLATFKAAWDEVAADLVASDEGFAKIYAHLNAFRADYQIWQEWAYMPRPSMQGK